MKTAPILFVLAIIFIVGTFFGNSGSFEEVVIQGAIKMIIGFGLLIAACASGRKPVSQEQHQP